MAKNTDALETMKDLWKILPIEQKGEFARWMIDQAARDLVALGVIATSVPHEQN